MGSDMIGDVKLCALTHSFARSALNHGRSAQPTSTFPPQVRSFEVICEARSVYGNVRGWMEAALTQSVF